MLSLYGKLPTAGDFLSVEVPRPLLRPIEDWLAASTAAARESIEGDWNEAFDAGATWCFWIGEKVLGRRMAGVLRPSQDKVGRRFPVILFTSSDVPDSVPEAPVIDDDVEFYVGLADELDYLAGQSPDEVSARLKAAAVSPGLGEPVGLDAPEGFFWAVAPEAGRDNWPTLVEEARSVDHALSSAGRSYWWYMGSEDRPPALFATEGMPGPQIFGWFVTGVAA